MKYTKYIFCISFLFFFSNILIASLSPDDYRFNLLNVEKGLSNNEVKCIYKDRTGFVWFGTASGLNRFDGYEITVYKQDLSKNSAYSFNNDIVKIQEAFDGKFWIHSRTGYTIYDPVIESFIENIGDYFFQYAGVDNFNKLYIDLGKNFWFIRDNEIRMFDTQNNKSKIFHLGEAGGLSMGNIKDIKQGKNRYWFLYENGLIECMDAQTYKIIYSDSTLIPIEKSMTEVDMQLFIDSTGDVWVYGLSLHYGVAYLNISSYKWDLYSSYANSKYRISNDMITAIEEDEEGNIWIGTDHGGINIIDKKNGNITQLIHQEDNPYSLPQNTVKGLYRDDNNIMWAGTYKKGVAYYHESIYKFKTFGENIKIPYNDINCFFEDEKGNLWIGSNGGGLIYYDRSKKIYTQYKHNPNNTNSPAGDVIVSLEKDKSGNLWIGYFLEGMDKYDGQTFIHYNQNDGIKDIILDGNVWKIHCDKSGNLWAGTLRGGVSVINPQTGDLIKNFDLHESVFDIMETRAGKILVTSLAGIYQYNVTTDQLDLYEKEALEKINPGKIDTQVLLEDSRELLWIGSRNGLFLFNPYTKETQTFKEENGLSGDMVQGILEDSQNNIWIATNRGITCIKVSTDYNTPGYFFSLQRFDKSEGLQDEQINYNAVYQTKRGELVFGGSTGFNIFLPEEMSFNNNIPKVVLTDFHIYDQQILPQQPYNGRILLDQSIVFTEDIHLKYSDNIFSITFTALDFCMPDKSRFYYKLEGFNDKWLEADQTTRKVTYTNLNPGKYTFHLKAINNDGYESDSPILLNIHIHPPFWNTVWAWCIYTLIIIGGLILYRRYLAKKAEQKVKYAQEKLRITQQHEMDEMKLRFFTNISHEFRTPLTLILTPLEEMLNKTTSIEEKESLSVIQRNALQLLRLVNQLLDFRKLDVHRHVLQESLGDVVQFVKEQSGLFNEAMERKNITFQFKTTLTHLYMYFDADKLAKVIMNLLSNAYKFTANGGNITVELNQTTENKIQIIISDNGIGIPEDALEKIFDRFYQVNTENGQNFQGSGIGLNLTKEFVKLHGGEIWAENISEGGCRFILLLPCKEEVVDNIESLVSASMEAETNTGTRISSSDIEESMEEELPKLLIVEDNEDLLLFLSTKLKDQYKIFQAADGVDGLNLAFQEIPDMILSDVMMPRMDGIEMCKKLKADIRTSHIPLILLTAKSGEESKLEGLNAGADDYITKPFNFEILAVKIRNLVEMQHRKQRIFEEQIRIEPSKIAVSSLDEQLIKRALEYTEAQLSNPDFSVEELSRELGMSRVHLYKKLSTLTGKTPIEFIRVVRLKRAAQLLEDSQLTVSEIAYEVGFNNPKYFRKYFKEEFGVLPSQYSNKRE